MLTKICSLCNPRLTACPCLRSPNLDADFQTWIWEISTTTSTFLRIAGAPAAPTPLHEPSPVRSPTIYPTPRAPALPPLPFPHLRRLAPCHLEGPFGSLRLSIRWRGPCLTAGGAPIPASITLSTSTTAGAMQAGPRAVNVSLTITLLHRRHSRVPSPTPPLPRAPPRLSLPSFPLHPTGLPLRRARALPHAKARAAIASPKPMPEGRGGATLKGPRVPRWRARVWGRLYTSRGYRLQVVGGCAGFCMRLDIVPLQRLSRHEHGRGGRGSAPRASFHSTPSTPHSAPRLVPDGELMCISSPSGRLPPPSRRPPHHPRVRSRPCCRCSRSPCMCAMSCSCHV